MSCSPIDPVCQVVGGIAGQAAGDAFSSIVVDFNQACTEVFKMLATAWTRIPTPQIADAGGHPLGAVAWLQGDVMWIAEYLAVLGLIIGAGRMAYHRRSEEAKDVISGIVTFVVVSAVGLGAVSLLTTGGDQFSSWIINQAGASSPDELFDAGSLTNGPGLQFFFDLLALGATIVQIFLLYVRGAMLIVLGGMLPITAGASTSASGRAGLRRHIKWLAGFVLYKPVAALIYAIGFKELGQPGIVTEFFGLGIVLSAILALPAVMSLLTSAVDSVGGSGGGGGGAMSAAGVAIASGAIQSSGGRGSAGGSGGRGPDAQSSKGKDSSPSGSSLPTQSGPGAGKPSGGSTPGGGAPGGAASGGSAGSAGTSGASAAGTGTGAGVALQAGAAAAKGAHNAVENTAQNGPTGGNSGH